MAEVIVQRACAKLRSAIGDEAVVRSNFIGDLRYMLGALESIQPVLERAEMEPFRSIPVARWLQLACSAACKTIDTVNELHDARPQAAATVSHCNWPFIFFLLIPAKQILLSIACLLSSPT